jgi:hypothetical protein
MSLLTSDLARNFAIGFLLGALAVSFQLAPDMWLNAVPDAVAEVLG